MKKFIYALITAFLGSAALVQAQIPELQLVQFSTGFSNPIGIFDAGDNRLFVVEQTGKIILLSNQGVRNPTPFLDISAQISGGGERGLLGLAFHPDFAANGYFFVNYTNLSGATVISRFSANGFNPDLAIPGSEEILLTIQQPYANHNGGNIVFGPDGYLYIGMGDGGSGGDPQNNAQNRQSLLGKMLRINVNTVPYTTPANNPFTSDPNTLDEIWAVGLRNPWRFSFDRITGDMWIGDVGQDTWEEINFEPANTGGLNYGWRCYESDNVFNTAGCQPQTTMTFPVSSYENNSTNGCSVTGGFVYRGGKFGRLYGHYLYTDYCSGRFRSVSKDGAGSFTTTQLQQFLPFQYASLGEDRFGELYVAGKGNGNIYKIEETTCQPTAVILGDTARIFCPGDSLVAIYGEGNSCQWYNHGQQIAGATSSTYQPTSEGVYHVVVTNAANCVATSGTVMHLSIAIPMDGINGLNQQYNLTDNPSTLSVTDLPGGGTFSGPGVNGNIFNPSQAGPGTHTITYTYTGICGGTSTHSQTVTVLDPNGIAESIAFSKLSLFPNPATKDFFVNFSVQNSGEITAEILNTLGQTIYTKKIYLEQGDQQVPISVPSAPNGMYLLTLLGSSGSATTRFILE